MITVCDISAFARWGEPGLAEKLGEPCREPKAQSWSLSSAAELATLDLRSARVEATERRPLHILVSKGDRRIRCGLVRNHIWSTPLPKDRLYRLADDILLASPGFCLQQMSARSSLARAASVGMEICSTYARSPRAEGGFHKRPALSGLDDLTRDFAHNHGYGARRARQALDRVMGDSCSPMETVVALLLTLPQELGGCGLPQPRLNLRAEIPPDLQVALGKPYLVVDLCWPDLLLIVEHNSYDHHSGSREVDGDDARNEGLRDVG